LGRFEFVCCKGRGQKVNRGKWGTKGGGKLRKSKTPGVGGVRWIKGEVENPKRVQEK